MSLVDSLKRLKSSAQARLLPHPVIFHHVPKCGGTSVGRALRQRYLLSQTTVLPEESFRAFETFTGRTDRQQMLIDVLDLREQMLLYELYRGVQCFSGHVRFSEIAYRQFGSRYSFITILREPVARFISHYFWSHGKPDAHARIDEDFAAFLETDRARRLGATYVEYFCGLPKDVDLTAQTSIDAAIANLQRFDVIGQLEDLRPFEAALKAKLGARIRIGHENKMRQATSVRDTTITPELKARAAALCAPDIAVWESARP